MTSRYSELDLAGVRTVSISERGSKVSIDSYGEPVKGGKAFRRWLNSLPGQLAVNDLKKLTLAIRRAASSKNREIIWMMGAHVIKCGLPPYLIGLMKKGYITTLAMNGASVIHDLEMAFFGETSEDVAANLEKGIFGFCEDTMKKLFDAVAGKQEDGTGLGEAIGMYILEEKAPHRKKSLLAQSVRSNLPVTVHIAIGTDIIHQHPGFDGSLWGGLSARDFRIFCDRVHTLGQAGGVVLNLGSAVILPEVFLKAYSVARNLGASFTGLTTANMDMIQHYRPGENILNRPAGLGADAISLTGHHEIMVPLLYSALMS